MSRQSNLNGVTQQVLRDLLGTRCMAKALLAEGTNAGTIKTTNAISYSINGILYTKAATDNIAVNALPAQAAGTTRWYLIQIDSAGAITLKQSAVATPLALPDPDNDKCPIGLLKIVTANAATFTAGTTDLGATDVVDTFYDITVSPGVPPS